MTEVYEIQVKPRAVEIMANDEIKFPAIIDYLQQIAHEHAFVLDVDVTQLLKRNLTWFLTRYYIEIFRYPKATDRLTIRSWVAPSESEKFSLRDFEILDATGKVIGTATTSWILFNLKKKRPISYLQELGEKPLHAKRSVQYDFPKLPLPEKIDTKTELTVRRSDLDLNRHVNNRIYFEWFLESIPIKYLENYHITNAEISFKQQAFYQERILVETQLQKAKASKDTIVAVSKISKRKNRELLSKIRARFTKVNT